MPVLKRRLCSRNTLYFQKHHQREPKYIGQKVSRSTLTPKRHQMGQEHARDSCGKGRIYVTHGGKDSRTTLAGRRAEGGELGQTEGVGLLNCQWPRGWG